MRYMYVSGIDISTPKRSKHSLLQAKNCMQGKFKLNFFQSIKKVLWIEVTLAKWQLHCYLLAKQENRMVIAWNVHQNNFRKNEGVALINILILVKLLNAWIAGDTAPVET